ncbi:glycosyltransferase [Flavobacterium sp.]|uniref:glycosyltransferase n=1 Tax=Flavobacterium sp. TaxID=239 RepID=UPI00375156D6
MTVDILMATYNGEKYLEAQIFSLLSQTHKNWNLYIHDDGSADNTVSIIHEFMAIDNRVKFIEDGIKFGNAGMNFFHLLQFSESPFAIFCDQDDIWFETKLEALHSGILNKDNSIPQIVFANGYLYSDKRDIFSNNIPHIRVDKLNEMLFMNAGLQGCSIIFNKCLLEIAVNYKGYIAMHDHLITMLAILFGNITYLERRLMLYRQEHQGKVTTNVLETSGIWKVMFENRFPVIDKNHYKANVDIFNFFEKKLTVDQIKLFEEYMLYYNSVSKNKCYKIIVKNKFSVQGSVFKLLLKTLLRPIKKLSVAK